MARKLTSLSTGSQIVSKVEGEGKRGRGRGADEGLGTLPDSLREGLDIVFVGINPSVNSARAGHYFYTPTNRFWPAVNMSGLFPIPMSRETDYRCLEFNIGFTDVAKRPSASASAMTAKDFREGTRVLKEKLLRYQPRFVCFNGLTAYNAYLKCSENVREPGTLGLQTGAIGSSKIFVVPSPSAANAAFSLDTLADWYTQLKALRDSNNRARH